MGFVAGADRSAWKKPRRHISAAESDAIKAAMEKPLAEIDAIAARFDISAGTALRIGQLGRKL
jgi:hypothetical protein